MMAWALYLLGSFLCLWCFWRLTAVLPLLFARIALLIAGAAILLTPWKIRGYDGHYAPAIVVTFFEILSEDENSAPLEGVLAIGGAAAIGVSIALGALFYFLRK